MKNNRSKAKKNSLKPALAKRPRFAKFDEQPAKRACTDANPESGEDSPALGGT
jgi:hypothetical protein